MKSETNKNFDLFINELIYLIQYDDNHYAFELLKKHLQRWFTAVTWRNIKKFPHIVLNFSHLDIYWAMSLLKSVYIYNSWLGIPFSQFSIQQYNWFLLSYLRTFIRHNYILLNYSTLYDENLFSDSYKIYKSDYFSKNDFNFENKLNFFIKNQKNKFSTTLEQNVFEMKIKGYTSKEIVNLTKYNYRTIDNAWQRVKKKYLKFKKIKW